MTLHWNALMTYHHGTQQGSCSFPCGPFSGAAVLGIVVGGDALYTAFKDRAIVTSICRLPGSGYMSYRFAANLPDSRGLGGLRGAIEIWGTPSLGHLGQCIRPRIPLTNGRG